MFKIDRLMIAVLCLYIFLQALFPQIERYIYWGELIVILSFISCLSIPYDSTYQKRIIFLVYAWLFLMPMYATLISIFNFQEFILLYYFRHLSYFYYAVFFFAAYRWGGEVLSFLASFPLVVPLFVLIGAYLMKFGGIGVSILLGILWIACLLRKNTVFTFWLGFLILVFAHLNGSGTGKVAALALCAFPLLVMFLKAWVGSGTEMFRRFLLRTMLIASLVLSIVSAFWFSSTTSNLISAGRNINAYENGIPGADLNVVWRLVLWTHLFDRFIDHPQGVGIGTPLHEDYLTKFMMLESQTYQQEEKYVVGAHNSYITFLVRFGLAFIAYAIFMGKEILATMSQFLNRVQFKPIQVAEGRLVFALFLIFALACVQASFNVVLESPLYAGMYWFTFGLFTKKIGVIDSLRRLDESVVRSRHSS